MRKMPQFSLRNAIIGSAAFLGAVGVIAGFLGLSVPTPVWSHQLEAVSERVAGNTLRSLRSDRRDARRERDAACDRVEFLKRSQRDYTDALQRCRDYTDDFNEIQEEIEAEQKKDSS